MGKNEIINEFEAAETLNLAVQTLRNWRCQRRGPSYIRMGDRAIRYRMKDLLDFINAGRIDPKA